MSRAAGMSAGQATRIAREDPAFTVPRRPRLLPGLVVVPLEDGLLVEGGERRQVFRGPAARTWLPGLVEALAEPARTTRDVDGLAGRLGISTSRVTDAVALLYAAGLLDETPEDAPATQRLGEAAAATATWVARHLDTSRLHRSREHAVAALHGTTVHVAGPAGPAAELAALLAEHGVTVDGDRAGSDLVVVLGIGHDDEDLVTEVEVDCARRGSAWLRVLAAATGPELGPVVSPHDRRCSRCLADVGLLRLAGPAPSASTLTVSLAATAHEVVRLLSGSGRPLSTTGVVRLVLETWTHELHAVPSLPGCRTCDPGGEGRVAGTDVVHVFDAAVRFPALARQRPKDHQQHYSAKNLALQSDPRVRRRASSPLPEPPRPLGTGGNAPTGLTVASLAAVLHNGFGWLSDAGGEHRRCAPTGGNIGSPAAHVVVRDVPGLEPGRYRYEGEDHGLVLLEDTGPSDADLLLAVESGTDADEGPPGVLLVVSGDLERVASKYVEFGARVVHLDAGVALAQARLAALAAGVLVRGAVRWDDVSLARGLGIDHTRTPVTAVAGLWSATDEGDVR